MENFNKLSVGGVIFKKSNSLSPEYQAVVVDKINKNKLLCFRKYNDNSSDFFILKREDYNSSEEYHCNSYENNKDLSSKLLKESFEKLEKIVS